MHIEDIDKLFQLIDKVDGFGLRRPDILRRVLRFIADSPGMTQALIAADLKVSKVYIFKLIQGERTRVSDKFFARFENYLLSLKTRLDRYQGVL